MIYNTSNNQHHNSFGFFIYYMMPFKLKCFSVMWRSRDKKAAQISKQNDEMKQVA